MKNSKESLAQELARLKKALTRESEPSNVPIRGNEPGGEFIPVKPDFWEKVKRHKEKRQEARELIAELEKELKIEISINELKRLSPIKGLNKQQVDILCDQLIEYGFLEREQYFHSMFEPYFGNEEGHRIRQHQTKWLGKPADITALFNGLPITSQKHWATIANYITINGEVTTKEKLSAHARQSPYGHHNITKIYNLICNA